MAASCRHVDPIMSTGTNEINGKTKVEPRLNWGALGITLLWLIRNGFWLTALIYIASAAYFWPAALLLSLVFFVRGTEWSWGGGQRWNSVEEFERSQSVWAFVGVVLLSMQLLALAYFLLMYASR